MEKANSLQPSSNSPVPVNGASPFDAIKQVRADGSEFWSARDLMPLLGYDQWRNFERCINEARRAVQIVGAGQNQFVDSSKMVDTGSGARRAVADVELTRYGAYMVAMSCDGRKPEVAEAKTYFAVKTREAEIAVQQVDMSDPLAVIEAESARVAKAVEIARGERARADKAEKRLAVEQKHRAAIEGGDGINFTSFSKKYFSEVRHSDFFEHLYAHGWLINQRGTRVRSDGSVRDGYEHRMPTAKGRSFIYAHDLGLYGSRRRFEPRVRPQGEIALRDALASEGLPVNEHSTGLVLITGADLKELM